MIVIKIKKWVPIGGLEHVATSYRITSDIDGNEVIDENLNDSENLTTYYSPAIVPVNTKYYVRVKRHFNDGTDSGWSEPVARMNRASNGGILSNLEIKVHKPLVNVDETSLNDPNSTTYTITTSEFNAENESHGYTVWIVKNDKDEILHYEISTTELTSKTLSKNDRKFVNSVYLNVYAIHGTHSGIESEPGYTRAMISYADFKLVLSNRIQSSQRDLKITIDRLGNPNTVVSKIELRNLDNDLIWETNVSPNVSEVKIPKLFLHPDTDYIVIGYGDVVDDKHSYRINFRTRPEYVLDKIDPTFEYKKMLSTFGPAHKFPVLTHLITNEIYNSKLLLPWNNQLRYGYIQPDGEVVIGNENINGITFTNTEVENCYIKTLSGSIVITDTQVDNDAKFVTYEVDYYNNTGSIKNYLTIESGTSISKNGGLVVQDKSTLYVGRHGHTGLEKYDISGSSIEVTDLGLPAGESAIETITSSGGDGIIVFCKDSNKIYQYSYETGVFEEKDYLPVSFRKRSLKAMNLINGDAIVWKYKQTETVDGEEVTDNAFEALYIDNINNRIEEIILDNERRADILGSVLLNTGKLLFIENINNPRNAWVME